MIGLILTGQGSFASGMAQALCEISGEQESFQAVDFPADLTREELKIRLARAIESLADCDSTIILCDLVGGIPYSTAVEVGYPLGCEIVAGTNLGMLVEINAARFFYSDNRELADQALTVGKDQVARFVYIPTGTHGKDTLRAYYDDTASKSSDSVKAQ